MKKFVRTIEDFVCEHCGASVQGNGYTNHCPDCLWSKHVDINPGDRSAQCGGLMQPSGLELDHGEEFIVHVCEMCGFSRRNRVNQNDNQEALIAIAKKLNADH